MREVNERGGVLPGEQLRNAQIEERSSGARISLNQPGEALDGGGVIICLISCEGES
jgi:hypothetical protein